MVAAPGGDGESGSSSCLVSENPGCCGPVNGCHALVGAATCVDTAWTCPGAQVVGTCSLLCDDASQAACSPAVEGAACSLSDTPCPYNVSFDPGCSSCRSGETCYQAVGWLCREASGGGLAWSSTNAIVCVPPDVNIAAGCDGTNPGCCFDTTEMPPTPSSCANGAWMCEDGIPVCH
jgi:hypothetical protein